MMPTAFGRRLYRGSVGPIVVCGHLISPFNWTLDNGTQLFNIQDTELCSMLNLHARSIWLRLWRSCISTNKNFCGGASSSTAPFFLDIGSIQLTIHSNAFLDIPVYMRGLPRRFSSTWFGINSIIRLDSVILVMIPCDSLWFQGFRARFQDYRILADSGDS